VPPPVAALIADLTAKDPADRPASATEVAARAARLRDAPAAAPSPDVNSAPAASAPLKADSGQWDALRPTLAGLPGETLTNLGVADADYAGPGGRERRPPGLPQRRARRPLMLAAAAIAIVAGLAVWLLIPGTATPQRHPAAGGHAAAPAASRTVRVSNTALDGKPVSAVARRLRELGLVVRLAWVPSGHQAPGTVVSVTPGGKVRIGTTVVVTGATQPAGHEHRHGHGGGNGGSHGHGDGNNGGNGDAQGGG
jgi:serine/threonine-protein kinase